MANPAAARLLTRAAGRVDRVTMHDAWTYELVTGAGGQVIHDDEPGLLYRQHGANQIGAADGMRARAGRMARLLTGGEGAARDTTLATLTATADLLTPENRACWQISPACRSGP